MGIPASVKKIYKSAFVIGQSPSKFLTIIAPAGSHAAKCAKNWNMKYEELKSE